MTTESSARAWLNPAVAGMGLTSFFSDLGHEAATAILPLFLDSLGAAAGFGYAAIRSLAGAGPLVGTALAERRRAAA
jgi:hypothetical protein